MSGMEFSWRMVATLAWPLVVLAVLIVYRKWITQTFTSLKFKFGSVEAELNSKVDTTGREIASALSEMPQPIEEGEVPTSLVDLMPVVNRNRGDGIQDAFDLVHQALKENYPQLRRVPRSQIPQAVEGLASDGLLDKDVALSVKQLYELLGMPEWNSDRAGDTRGYAFLMLAEGAIHGIIRSAQAHGVSAERQLPGRLPGTISSSWRGTYNEDFPIELHILSWTGDGFTGEMIYPDGGTVTSIHGQVDVRIGRGSSFPLSWTEDEYIRHGRRDVELKGRYRGTVSGTRMEGTWYRESQSVARFEMTAAGSNAETNFRG
jgi:hypothetical protein